MNHPFIKSMSEAYYNDFNLNSLNIWKTKQQAINELSNELIGLMNNLKLEDENLYIELHENSDMGFNQKVLYNLLDNYLSEIYNINSDILEFDDLTKYKTSEEFLLNYSEGVMLGAAVGGLLSILIGIANYKKLSKVQWHILTKLNDLNKKVATFINKKTLSGKVKQAVFNNNTQTCYKKCNVKDSEVTAWAGISLNSNSLVPTYAAKQVDCLIECYLLTMLQNIEFLCESYSNCLKGSGERGKDINDIMLLLSPVSSEGICKPYFKLLKEHYVVFREAVEVLFEDPQKRDEWNQKYKSVLSQQLKLGTINNGFSNKQYDKKPFDKKPFDKKPFDKKPFDKNRR